MPDIDKLYPEFIDWVHNIKGYMTAGGIHLIKLWYEFLKEVKHEAIEV